MKAYFLALPINANSGHYLDLGFKINMKHLLEKLTYAHQSKLYNEVNASATRL